MIPHLIGKRALGVLSHFGGRVQTPTGARLSIGGGPSSSHRGLRAPVVIGHEGSDFTGEDATGRSIGCCVPGFLTRNSKGDVLYATAKHLLGVNGGVQPEIA